MTRATVRVHECPDGTLAVLHGPRCLARYHADGHRSASGMLHLAQPVDCTDGGPRILSPLRAKYFRRSAEIP